ncbi:MAG: hypothetical protein KDN19_09315 [Verrucomicrobiae bacterium]|nr:hypothetical protein [Verrucomicrobiae bacterium]
MQRKLLLSAIAAFAFGAGFSSCEKHDWEKTQVLFKEHGSHGEEEHHGEEAAGAEHHGEAAEAAHQGEVGHAAEQHHGEGDAKGGEKAPAKSLGE